MKYCMRLRPSFRWIVSCFLFAAVAVGQDSTVREVRLAYLRILNPGSESLSVRPNSTTDPSVLERTRFHPTEVITATMPFNRAGDLTELGADRYLISGRSVTGAGALVAVRLARGDDPALVIEATATFPGVDLYSAAWSAGRLVAVDFSAKKLLGAAWDGASNTLAAVSFVEIADGATVPALARPDALTLQPGPQCVYLGWGPHRILRIWHDDEWRIGSDDLHGHRSRPRQYEVQPPMIARSAGPIMVVGEAGDFAVVDEASGSTVGTGTISDVDTPASWTGPPELVPGNPHRIEGAGGSASRSFAPLVRHGAPSESTTISARRGMLDPDLAYTGSTALVVATTVGALDPIPASSEVLPAALWLHLRRVDGVDPVIFLGDQALLDSPPIGLGFTVPLQSGKRSAAVAYTLPIPPDPSLAGVVLLCQFGFERMGAVVATDVFGTTLRDGGGAARGGAASTPRGAARWVSRQPSERSAIHSAATRWLRSLESESPDEAGRMYRAVRSR